MQQRREEIGISAAELAYAAGMSTTTLSKVENGGSARPSTLAELSAALQWPTDTLLRVSRGEPVPDLPVTTHRPTAQRLADLEHAVQEIRDVVSTLEDLLLPDRDES